MARQWILTGQEGFEKSLEYQDNIAIPSAESLGPNEVVVKIHAASLNYRELVIADVNGINGPITPPVVPACDGAGVVEAVGSAVREFKPGHKVVMYGAPKLAEAQGDDAVASIADAVQCLGQGPDGTLRSHGVFDETALVHAPTSLGWVDAASLMCTWLTAWNALFGIKGREAGPGSWVLVQGTGGVSVATLQLAVAAGATVVATTSTESKEGRLRGLGATHTVNYRTNEAWGQEARGLTPDGRGFDYVVDIAGNETLLQSLVAIRPDGIVVVAGGVGGNAETVPLFSTLIHTCIVRGLILGTRNQARELIRFIDEKGIKPAVDDVVFELAETKEAYRRLKAKKHFAKVVIRIDHAGA